MSDTVYIVGSNFNTYATEFAHVEPHCDDVQLHVRFINDTYRVVDRSGKYESVDVIVQDTNMLYDTLNLIPGSDAGGIRLQNDDHVLIGEQHTFNWIHDKSTDHWTIETWLWIDRDERNHDCYVLGTCDMSHETGFKLVFVDGFLQFHVCRGTPGVHAIEINTNVKVKFDLWQHVMITKQQDHVRIFIDGERVFTSIWHNSSSQNHVHARQLFMGHPVDGFRGMFQDFRMTKNHAVFKDDVSYPQINNPCTVIPTPPDCSQVVFHVQQLYDGPLYDRTSNYNHVQVHGAPVFDSHVDPFYEQVGSIKFDGVHDHAEYVHTDFLRQHVFDVSSDDFTYELWFNTTRNNTRQGLMSTHDGSVGVAGVDAIEFEIRADNTIMAHFRKPDNTGVATVSNMSIQPNRWYHLAVVRHDQMLLMFINGALVNTPTQFTGSIRSHYGDNTPCPLFIGKYHTHMFQGHMQDIRFTRSSAIYTESFVPLSLFDSCWTCPTTWIDHVPFDDEQYWCE